MEYETVRMLLFPLGVAALWAIARLLSLALRRWIPPKWRGVLFRDY